MFTSARTSTAVAVIALALVAPSLAHADTARATDPRDAHGALDIAYVSHSHSGASVVHTLRTYGAFSSRMLTGATFIAFGLDTTQDTKLDRLVLVFSANGALRGVLADTHAKPLALLQVSRPDQRTLKVTIPTGSLGSPGAYSWLATTSYRSKKTCRKSCMDVAPNRGLIFHKLIELPALAVVVHGAGQVISLSGGIKCPTQCKAKFKPGQTVTLRTVPDSNQVFSGWQGACSGTGDCTVTMDSTKTVTATFTPQ